MKIVPVLDVLNGQVVHGTGGLRAEYRPLKSRLTASTQPLDVANALKHAYGFSDFYVADLDAIAGAEPAFSMYAALQTSGFRLWVDAGVVEAGRAFALADYGVARIIAGLETLAGPQVLADLCKRLGSRIVFSLDLRAGRPLGADRGWKEEPWEILEQAVQASVSAVLVLDLARVGMRSGTGTEELAARLSATYAELEIIAGGGVRNGDELRRLKRCGVGTALMATALHEGSITPDELATLIG